MKKYSGLVLLCLLGNAAVWAEPVAATIKEVAGKVEYKLPQQEWQQAKTGDTLMAGTLISTGFKSTAIITTGMATVTVKPITRLSIDELIQSNGTAKTQLFLKTGRVRAEVHPAAGEKADFSVRSPTATASVRGTEFEFDGYSLTVEHGSVLFNSGIGIAYTVGGGRFSALNSDGTVAAPIAAITGSLDSAFNDIENLRYNQGLNNRPELFTQQTEQEIEVTVGW